MRRLHPYSAVQRALRTAVQVGAFGFFAGTMLAGPLGLVPFWIAFVLAGGGAVAGAAIGVVR